MYSFVTRSIYIIDLIDCSIFEVSACHENRQRIVICVDRGTAEQHDQQKNVALFMIQALEEGLFVKKISNF